MNVLIANLVASIKVVLKHNAVSSKTRHSKYVESIVVKLIKLGVIKSYVNFNQKNTPYLSFVLNYIEGIPMLYDIKVISKSGKKLYSSVKDLKSIKSVFTNVLISTDKGILDYAECMEYNIGGEIILVYT